MSTLSNLDGGDLEMTLKKHRARKTWLASAERWLAYSENDDAFRFSLADIRIDWQFSIEVPRAIWEPQIRSQIEQVKQQLAELDRIARSYIEAELKA